MIEAQILSPTIRARYSLIITLLLTAVGFGLRLHYLDGDNFWTDEIRTIQAAQTGATAIQGSRDHPPLIYLATALSINSLGENEFAARLPSALAGTLAIPAIVLLGALLGAPGAGLWAALLLALSPFHLRYSQLSRHYALLMLLSLISTVMLYRALLKPKWSYWLAYTIVTAANLYTHFAALLVLGSQAIVIAGWTISRINRRRATDVKYPAAAVTLALVFFLPWAPRFIAALEYNVGAETISETGTVVPLSAWLQEAYQSFGMFSEYLAAILLLLAFLGLLFWAIERAWLSFGLILGGLALPLILILVFQVARGALPRYIIFMLPLYLVAAGYGIYRTLWLAVVGVHHRGVGTRRREDRKMGRRGESNDTEVFVDVQQDLRHFQDHFTIRNLIVGRQAIHIFYVTATIVVAIAFAIVAWPLLQERYRTVYYDWNSLAHYIQAQSEGEILLLAAELNEPLYLDQMSDYLPYYLDEAGLDYLLFSGSRLTKEEVGLITRADVPVWSIVYQQNGPPVFEDDLVEVTGFSSDLYVIHDDDQSDTSLDKVIATYEGILDRADIPEPKCLLERDLALLHLAGENPAQTHQLLERAKGLCPDLDHWTLVPIYEGLLLEESPEARSEEALEITRLLLFHNPKNKIALDFLTTYDLLKLLERDGGQIQIGDSPQPVQKERFVMPQDGDWGDVIFLHPPASVRFQLSLPDEPLIYSSRIALAPESWAWGGDGATFILKIKPGSGAEIELYRQHIGNDPAEQQWHEVSLPLTKYAGQDVILTLATEEGPAGDGTGDWAGWERPRILLDLPE